MEARLESPVLFRKILDALRELVEEANIDCNQSGLSIQAMDANHVALVAMHLNAKGFDEFKCEDNLTLGVNLGSIQKILKCGDANDTLTLKSNEENSELKFQLDNQGRVFEFSMALMDIETDRLTIPDSEPEAAITMASSEFQRICKDLTQFGDTVKICVNKKTATFSVSGTTGNGTITLGKFETAKDDSLDIQCETKVELSFALRFLTLFTKAAPLADTVRLDLSSERPLMVQFDLEDDAGYIKYYLAPKVDDEDEE